MTPTRSPSEATSKRSACEEAHQHAAPASELPVSISTVTSSAAGDSHFADLVEQLTSQLPTGDSSAIDAILDAHPAEADRLRRLLPTLQVLAELNASRGVAVSAALLPSPSPQAADS